MRWLLSYLKRKLCERKLTKKTPSDDSTHNPAHTGSLVEMLQASPHRDIDLTPERCKDTGRDVTFE